MRNFLINFTIISIIAIVFFRPQLFKREIKNYDEFYYFHGFPITTIVKAKLLGKEIKEYEIEIIPIKSNIWIGGIESDIEKFNLWNLELKEGWNISGPEDKSWAWINQYDENNKNEIKLKIKSKVFIRILFGHHPTHGIVKIKIDTIERIINLSTDKEYVDWYYLYPQKHYFISPESKKIILIQNNQVININQNYFLIFLNIIFVLIYSLILSLIITFSKNLFLRYFSIIFTILFIYFLAYFPGIYLTDASYQALQAFTLNINDWHPPFHTLTFLIVLKLFKHIGFYVFIQIIIASLLFSWILYKFKIEGSEYILILLFSFPITSIFLINAWKDTYWTLSLIFFSFLLFFSYKENNLKVIPFIISLSFIMLLRYNGIILVPLLLIVMAFIFKNQIKKIIIIFISLIIIYLISDLFFYKVLKVQRTGFKYQKDFHIISAYVVNNYPFTNQEKEIIENVLSFDSIKKRYSRSVSSLFWGGNDFNFENFNKYRKELRKLAMKLILSDFKIFLEDEIFSSSWIWSLKVGNFFSYYRNNEYIEGEKFFAVGLYEDPILPQIQVIIEKLTDGIFQYFDFLTKPALYLYILLIIFIFYKNYRLIIIPSLLNTLVFIIISISDEFRFLASNHFIALFLIVLILKSRKSISFKIIGN